MTPEAEALQLLTHWYNGVLTDMELISQLTELPYETLELLPACPEMFPPTGREGLRERVLERKDKIAAALVRGEKLITIGGGITREEVVRRAAEGSPAARAMLGTRSCGRETTFEVCSLDHGHEDDCVMVDRAAHAQALIDSEAGPGDPA